MRTAGSFQKLTSALPSGNHFETGRRSEGFRRPVVVGYDARSQSELEVISPPSGQQLGKLNRVILLVCTVYTPDDRQ